MRRPYPEDKTKMPSYAMIFHESLLGRDDHPSIYSCVYTTECRNIRSAVKIAKECYKEVMTPLEDDAESIEAWKEDCLEKPNIEKPDTIMPTRVLHWPMAQMMCIVKKVEETK